MFDCSIFTEYDDTELSCLSEKITTKFRSRLLKQDSSKKQKNRRQVKTAAGPI
jgi:hypothetical protein